MLTLQPFTRYMDKRLSLQLNGSRRVTGILRGYDPFMNVVLDDTIEEVSPTEKHNIGMVVSTASDDTERLPHSRSITDYSP